MHPFAKFLILLLTLLPSSMTWAQTSYKVDIFLDDGEKAQFIFSGTLGPHHPGANIQSRSGDSVRVCPTEDTNEGFGIELEVSYAGGESEQPLQFFDDTFYKLPGSDINVLIKKLYTSPSETPTGKNKGEKNKKHLPLPKDKKPTYS